MNSGPVLRDSFSREDRLRKRREFQECYASGFRASGRLLQFLVRQRNSPNHARLGLSVPRKAGNAVARNRLRRRLREIFRKNRAMLPSGSVDIVVQCRAGAAQASFADLLADFLQTAGRVRSRTKHK